METFIRHYTDVIPPELCRDIIEHYEDFCANKQEVLVKNSLCHDAEGNKICGACDCQRLEMTRYDEFSDKVEPVVKYLRETVKRYVQDVGCVVNMWILNDMLTRTIRIKRYLNDGNQQHDLHSDSSNIRVCKRFVSIIVYLNDDFVGGETSFPFLNTKTKVETGSILLFPCSWNYLHNIEPITEGYAKYVIGSFLQYA